jgi:hypothetical protein
MKYFSALIVFWLLVLFAYDSRSADPTPVLPPNPVIPSMPTDTPNVTAASLESTTNNVFLDQAGHAPNINITQTGTNNELGTSELSPFIFRGDLQTFVSIQTGLGNSITGSIYGDNKGITTTIQQIGNNNAIDFNCGKGMDVSCGGSSFNWYFSGNSNTLYYNGGGNNQNSAINVDGNNNSFNFLVQAPNAAQNIQLVGSTNIFNLTQTGGAGAGNSFAVNLIGSGNTFNASQTGAIDNVISIKSLGSNGTYNIRQNP